MLKEETHLLHTTQINVQVIFCSLFLFNHLCRVDSSVITVWKGLFPIAGYLVVFFIFLCYIEIPVINAKKVDSNQTPHSVASDLSLHCCHFTFWGFPNLIMLVQVFCVQRTMPDLTRLQSFLHSAHSNILFILHCLLCGLENTLTLTLFTVNADLVNSFQKSTLFSNSLDTQYCHHCPVF